MTCVLPDLPADALRVRWIRAGRLPRRAREIIEAEMLRVCAAPGWNVKSVRLGKGRLRLLDLSCEPASRGDPYGPPKLSAARIALVQDHPFLSKLDAPEDVPRAVRVLYRAEIRLAHAKADNGWGWSAMYGSARESWATYREARRV